MFQDVQKLQKNRTRSVENIEPNGLFQGLYSVPTANMPCQGSMPDVVKRFVGYVCKTYKTQGKNFCESHSIDYDELEEAVLFP